MSMNIIPVSEWEKGQRVKVLLILLTLKSFWPGHEIRKLKNISFNTSAVTVFRRWMSPCRFQSNHVFCQDWALLAYVWDSSLSQDLVLRYLMVEGRALLCVYGKAVWQTTQISFILAEPAAFYMSTCSSWLWQSMGLHLSVFPELFLQVSYNKSQLFMFCENGVV